MLNESHAGRLPGARVCGGAGKATMETRAMGMLWNIVRVGIAAITIVAVSELSGRYPRYGGLLLSLPVVTALAFVMSWCQHHDLAAISALSKETLILVVLGLLFFVPFIFAVRLGIGFWTAFGSGLVLATIAIATWFAIAPKS